MARVEKRGPKRISVLYPLPSTAGTKTTGNDAAKKRVAAYCRVSSCSEEQLGSLNAQTSYYEKYIKERKDYIFAGIFTDEGISGTDLKKRDAFNRLMQDARDGQIDMIITKSLSRFGRNTLDCLKSLRELKSLGVDVYFEKEQIHSLTSQGEVLISLISAVAQTESLALSENVKWGIRRKYERGLVKSIPSGKFLGYDKDQDGNLVINEAQAAIVKRIYQEFLDGYGSFQIAKRLTAEKVPMAFGGKEWCVSHIKKVLTNEKIKGDTRFQKTYNVDYLTKRRAKNNGELPQYYIEGTHPGIIDTDTWECVQLELERQRRYCQDHHISTYHRSNEKHPLSARIICSTCGCTYMLIGSKKKGEEGTKYWRCSSFVGKQGTEIEGRTFTIIRPDRGSTKPYNIKRRKKPWERPMLCTDIRISAGEPELAFIRAWNRLVDDIESNLPEWQRAIEGEDLLIAYRARELMGLVEKMGRIDRVPYELVLKTLINQNETKTDFMKRINIKMRGEDKKDSGEGTSGSEHWYLGSDNRDVGSVHSDYRQQNAADLCEANYIAVYPIIGWWRERSNLGRYNSKIRYSLVVSISTPEVDVNLYTPIITQIEASIKSPVEIEVS